MTVTLIVLCVIVFDVLFALLIGRAFIGSLWNTLAKQYKAIEPGTDAVRKNFQSFRFGPVNLGFCVHVAVDEQFLHLLPSRFLRMCGALPISLPWDAITMKKKGRRYSTITIGRQNIHGPTWCLGIADPGSA